MNESPDAEITPPSNGAEVSAQSEAEPPKKRRGRPPGSGNKAKLNPEDPGSAPVSSGAPKKRGPKPSGERLAAMAKQLQGIHTLAAMATGIPECQINEGESAMLAQAFADVAAEYGLSVDGKTGAALQLFGACAMIYAPRYVHFRKRTAQERASAPIVVDMPDGNPPAH